MIPGSFLSYLIISARALAAPEPEVSAEGSAVPAAGEERGASAEAEVPGVSPEAVERGASAEVPVPASVLAAVEEALTPAGEPLDEPEASEASPEVRAASTWAVVSLRLQVRGWPFVEVSPAGALLLVLLGLEPGWVVGFPQGLQEELASPVREAAELLRVERAVRVHPSASP